MNNQTCLLNESETLVLNTQGCTVRLKSSQRQDVKSTYVQSRLEYISDKTNYFKFITEIKCVNVFLAKNTALTHVSFVLHVYMRVFKEIIQRMFDKIG